MSTIIEEDVMDTVLVDRDGDGIVTVTFNRPHKLNAFTKACGAAWATCSANWARMRACAAWLSGAPEREPSGPVTISPNSKQIDPMLDKPNSMAILMHGTIQALKSMPHPTSRHDPRHLCWRRDRDRRALQHPHLWRIEPLWCAHRQAGLSHGLPRDRRAQRTGGSWPRT